MYLRIGQSKYGYWLEEKWLNLFWRKCRCQGGITKKNRFAKVYEDPYLMLNLHDAEYLAKTWSDIIDRRDRADRYFYVKNNKH